jgi:hypothetical protein
MAGSYEVQNPNLAVAAAQTQAGLAASKAASDARQADAGKFMVENGAAVLPGHAMVGHAGDIGSDPDTSGPDASDA